MDEARWERASALAGTVGALLIAIQAVLVGLPPRIEAAPDQIATYYASNRSGVRW